LKHARTIAQHNRQNEKVELALALLEREHVLRGILNEVSAQYNLSRNDILPGTRRGNVQEACHEFFYRALTETLASTVLIGDACARDHTTVLYGSARYAYLHELPFPRGTDGGRYARCAAAGG
jgi:chromosomal replication initiation ATPase DnaA